MTLIVDIARSSKASPLSSMAHYVLLAEHIEIDFLCFEKQILGVWNFLQVMMNQNLCKSNKSCFKLTLL